MRSGAVGLTTLLILSLVVPEPAMARDSVAGCVTPAGSVAPAAEQLASQLRAVAAPTSANDDEKCRASQAQILSKVIVNWIDNLTVGAVNTAIGLGAAGVSSLANPLRGKDSTALSFRKGSAGMQVAVRNGTLSFGTNQSFGVIALQDRYDELFQNGISPEREEEIMTHEAGHSQQSAIVGPFYLPLVLLDYVTEGSTEENFIEHWADAEARALRESCGGLSFGIGTGTLSTNGRQVPILRVRVSLSDSVVTSETKAVHLKKVYEWLKTDVLLPLAQNRNTPEGAPRFDVSLLEKNVDVRGRLAGGDDRRLNLLIQSQQHYARVANNPTINRKTVTPLSARLGGGIEYQNGNAFRASASVRGSASLTRASGHDYGATVPLPETEWGFETSWGHTVDLSIRNRVRLYHEHDRHNLLGDDNTQSSRRYGLTVGPPQVRRGERNPLKRMNFTVERESNRYRLGEFDLSDKGLRLGAGITF